MRFSTYLPGPFSGHEKLEELQNWDSTSLITFIAMAESNNGVYISPGQIVTCSTVADLLRLAQGGKQRPDQAAELGRRFQWLRKQRPCNQRF